MVKFNSDTFINLYPGAKTDAKSHTAIEYKSEDSEYRVYIPGKDAKKSTAVTQPDGGLNLTLVQDHIIHGLLAFDDHSTVALGFDKSGLLTSATHNIEIENGGVHLIPTWIPKALDIGVELLGALGALETAGISEAVAQEVVADINSFCDAFNKIAGWINKLTDDGGRLNFPAEICHNMNKACTSTSVS